MNDAIRKAEAQTSAFADFFRREERIENLREIFRRDPGTVVGK